MMQHEPQPFSGESASASQPIGMPLEGETCPSGEKKLFDTDQLKQQAMQKRDEMTQAVKSRAEQYIEEQKSQASTLLDDLGECTRHCGEELRQKNHPQIGEYTTALAEKMESWGQSLRRQEPGYIYSQVQDFARQRPGLFLGGALVLGFAAIRFLKSSGQVQELGQQAKSSIKSAVSQVGEQFQEGASCPPGQSVTGTQYSI